MLPELADWGINIAKLCDYSVESHRLVPNSVGVEIVCGVENQSVVLECPDMH